MRLSDKVLLSNNHIRIWSDNCHGKAWLKLRPLLKFEMPR